MGYLRQLLINPHNLSYPMTKADKPVEIVLHGSLTDFISAKDKEKTSLIINFKLSPSAKDVIEAQGIPHTAIYKLQVNGSKKSLDYHIRAGDTLKVFPFEMADPGDYVTVYSSPSAFIANGHVAKLGRDLRLLGLDTLIETNSGDQRIINLSNKERRMILTRDLNLLKNGSARFGYWVRSTDPEMQLKEVLHRFDLRKQMKPFTRCTTCNGLLKEVSLEKIADKVPPKVKEWCSKYKQCNRCGKIYWKGSHYEKLKEKVEQVVEMTE